MAIRPEDLYRSPNALAASYSRFRVDDRPGGDPGGPGLLLTGHSHQAWPDCSLEGQVQAWEDAALLVDEKWDRAFAAAERVKRGYARWLGDEDGDATGRYSLASNTHDLLVRFLSALDLRTRPRLVTTDGEFHTIRRQLARLAEEGIEVVRVSAEEPETLAERLAVAIDDRTAAVLVSSVLFKSARIVPGLATVQEAAAKFGAELLLDTYHHLNIVPFSLLGEGLSGAYVVGGGYKYCQLGEGNCFLRVPDGCALRPVVTGWFAEFDALAVSGTGDRVAYGRGGSRFAGATYDPVSHYRGAAVLDFFDETDLTPELLREVSQHQLEILVRSFERLDAAPEVVRRASAAPLTEVGGFLVLETPYAEELCRELRRRGTRTDYRGTSLRLGPAPYLSDAQLTDGIACLAEVLRESRWERQETEEPALEAGSF